MIENKLRSISILCLYFLLFACGQNGIEDQTAEKVTENNTQNPPVPLVKDPNVQKSKIPIELFDFKLLRDFQCVELKDHSRIGTQSEDMNIDALNTDWNQDSFKIESEKKAISGDIHSVQYAFSKNNFNIFVNGQFSTNVEIVIEFGGVAVITGQVQQVQKRIYKITTDKIYYFLNNSWSELSQQEGQRFFVDGTFEISLATRYLGEVFNWPVWWIKLYSQNVMSQKKIDEISTEVQRGFLTADSQALQIENCSLWNNFSTKNESNHVFLDEMDQSARLNLVGYTSKVEELVSEFLTSAKTKILKHNFVYFNWQMAPKLEKLIEHPYHTLNSSTILLNTNFMNPLTLAAQSEIFMTNQIAEQLIEKWVNQANPSQMNVEKAVTTALIDLYIGNTMGIANQLKLFPFLPSDYANYFTQKAIFEGTINWQQESNYVFIGHMLSALYNATEIITAWESVDVSDLSESQAFGRFIDKLQEQSKELKYITNSSQLLNGWINKEEKFDEKFSPEFVLDHDRDGIWDLYEKIHSINIASLDSDNDGWTDFAEVSKKTNSNDNFIDPNMIVVEGGFADWLELIPQRVHLDEGAQGKCMEGGEISKYGALIGKEGLLLGVYSNRFEHVELTNWQVQIDVDSGKKNLLLQNFSNQKAYRIFDVATGKIQKIFFNALAPSALGAEWSVPLHILGLSEADVQKSLIKVKFVTSRGQTQKDFCDETKWVAPVSVDVM